MKKILAIFSAISIITLSLACGSEEEDLSDPTPEPAATATIEVTSSPIPDPTASSSSATPAPTEAPTSTPAEPTSGSGGEEREATEQDILAAMAIFEAVQPLPETESYRIAYNPGGGGDIGGVFHVWIIPPSTNEEYKEIILSAQNWFRERDYEPCDGALALTTKYMLETPATGDPLTYEPCSDIDN